MFLDQLMQPLGFVVALRSQILKKLDQAVPLAIHTHGGQVSG